MPLEPALESRGALIEYGWTLHNKVNEMLDKPHFSKEQFIAHMKSLGSRRPEPWSCTLAVVGGVAVGALGMYLYNRMRK
jgi:hypothetical protein